MITFKQFIQLSEDNTIGYHNDGPGSGLAYGSGALLGSDFTGSETAGKFLGNPLHLPSLDMTIPQVVRSGVVRLLEKNKNPIHILLSDGTRLHLTWDQYKRIEGTEPAIGKLMHVTFQRNVNNGPDETSQITQCRCD